MTKHKEEPQSVQDLVTTKVASAYAVARDKASGAAHEAATSLDANPLVALIGGVALGAAAGALIPRGEREQALLAPLGARLAGAVREALAAGRSAGLETLDGSGLSVDNLRDQVGRLIGQATQAAGSAGLAAFRAAKDTAGA